MKVDNKLKMKQSDGRFVRTRGYIALRIIALMVLLTARSPLEGALLGSGEVNGGLRGVGDFDEILTVLAIDTFSGPFCFTSPTGCIELVGGRFGVADAGSVFALRPSVTSNFAEIVGFLTNGLNDNFLVGVTQTDTIGVANGRSEVDVFFTGAGGPDFYGHVISGIDVTLVDIRFTPTFISVGPSSSVPGTRADLVFRI
ncbi:MAG: hypothetical protein KDC27_03815, partial [Acidobacteria bacterium]|nr:hypothetical protein [Acidobacteriota bacterium]